MWNAIHSSNASEIIHTEKPHSLGNLVGRVRAWLFGRSQRARRSPNSLNLAREQSRHAIEGAVAWQYPGQGQQREQAIRVATADLYVTPSSQGPGSVWR